MKSKSHVKAEARGGMPDTSRRLHELLEQLHQELEAADNLDADAEAELRAAMQDIRTTLEAREDVAAEVEQVADASRHHGPLSNAAREFSASHPLLARTIGQLADILGQSGI
jgi:hypothetical protein